MKRINDALIKDGYESWLDLDEDENQIKGLREVAQTQLDSCEKELREILGKMNMRDVGGTEPEWALSNKDYQALKATPSSKEVADERTEEAG